MGHSPEFAAAARVDDQKRPAHIAWQEERLAIYRRKTVMTTIMYGLSDSRKEGAYDQSSR